MLSLNVEKEEEEKEKLEESHGGDGKGHGHQKLSMHKKSENVSTLNRFVNEEAEGFVKDQMYKHSQSNISSRQDLDVNNTIVDAKTPLLLIISSTNMKPTP